jgi:hypothetical protein
MSIILKVSLPDETLHERKELEKTLLGKKCLLSSPTPCSVEGSRLNGGLLIIKNSSYL